MVTAVRVTSAVYVSSTKVEPELTVTLKKTVEVAPVGASDDLLIMVSAFKASKPSQQLASPPVSAEPVLQVVDPLSLNDWSRSAVVLAETEYANSSPDGTEYV